MSNLIKRIAMILMITLILMACRYLMGFEIAVIIGVANIAGYQFFPEDPNDE